MITQMCLTMDTHQVMQIFHYVSRIALVDTFKDEAEESLRVAGAMGDRLWGVRLDTPAERGRVTPDLVIEVRARLDQVGHEHVRIVVSGGIDPARIMMFRERNAPVDAYGIGSAISGAPPVDFTADIKVIEGQPVAKRGRIPGITPNPRLKRQRVNNKRGCFALLAYLLPRYLIASLPRLIASFTVLLRHRAG